VSVDTLRPDHLGCYGYPRPTSPAADALAREGTLFEDVTSPSPWTLPAHASLLTGLYPSRHGLKAHDRHLPTRLSTLASILGKRGFLTAAVVNSHNLSPRFGLDRGFQEFLYVEEDVRRREPTRRIVDQALEWLGRHRDRRMFLFVHTYDVHSDYASLPEHEREFVAPYRGPADGTTEQLIAHREGRQKLSVGDAPHLIDLYDAGIRQWDDELGRLTAFLRTQGMLDETLLVLTSDHGEEFLERGGVLHGRTQYQEVVRVPLILRGAGVPAGGRVEAPVSLLDVPATILARLGEPVPDGWDGSDLTPLFSEPDGRLGQRTLYGEADHNNEENDVTRAVRRREHKLHFHRLTGEVRLYDLAADPGERTDLAGARPTIVAELRGHLQRFLELRPPETGRVELTPEETERLRSLGYVR
jgi:arylsulfatase A-like enzyme